MAASIQIRGLPGSSGIQPMDLNFQGWVQAGSEEKVSGLINLQGFAKFKSQAGTMTADLTEENFLELLVDYVQHDESGEAVKAILEKLQEAAGSADLLEHLGAAAMSCSANLVENDEEPGNPFSSWDSVTVVDDVCTYEVEHDTRFKTVYEVNLNTSEQTVKFHDRGIL